MTPVDTVSLLSPTATTTGMARNAIPGASPNPQVPHLTPPGVRYRDGLLIWKGLSRGDRLGDPGVVPPRGLGCVARFVVEVRNERR
ncbi:MAG: hypothetical protein M0027_18910 [Candidatus Dormibacteraeota bacterium]|nr:hypothetical protein [Candidatus Dormibacteraeota bacterium]